MSMIFATQITAVATAVLGAFAFATAVLAYLAWRSQSGEIRSLREGKMQEAEERRWAQARRVYIEMKVLQGVGEHPGREYAAGRTPRPPAITATVHNTGDRPVYDVRIHWVNLNPVTQAGVEDQARTVGPAGHAERERVIPGGVATENFIPVGYFRDAAGLRWTVTPNGYLDPVPSDLRAGAPEIATRAAAKEAGHLQVISENPRGPR